MLKSRSVLADCFSSPDEEHAAEAEQRSLRYEQVRQPPENRNFEAELQRSLHLAGAIRVHYYEHMPAQVRFPHGVKLEHSWRTSRRESGRYPEILVRWRLRRSSFTRDMGYGDFQVGVIGVRGPVPGHVRFQIAERAYVCVAIAFSCRTHEKSLDGVIGSDNPFLPGQGCWHPAIQSKSQALLN
jgi:hypothetical protein